MSSVRRLAMLEPKELHLASELVEQPEPIELEQHQQRSNRRCCSRSQEPTRTRPSLRHIRSLELLRRIRKPVLLLRSHS